MRMRQKEQRKVEREEKVKQLAAARAQKQQEREAATTKKAQDRATTAKPKALQAATLKNLRKRRVIGKRSSVTAVPTAPEPPAKTTTRGRSVNLPKKYR